MTGRAVAALLLATLVVPVFVPVFLPVFASTARAQSFVRRVSGDACDQARSFDRGDSSPEAQEARRACRLLRFERRLATEREEAVTSEIEQQDARVEKWLEAKQPARVLHPLALEAFTGTGLASYGLTLSFMALTQLEFAASIGWRTVSYSDAGPQDSGWADYKNRTLAFTSRWYVANRELTPFVGAGIGVTTADLNVFWSGKDGSTPMNYQGDARGHSMSAHAGFQLAARSFRLSIEYAFQYVFFTGANQGDMPKTPNEQMRVVWQETLDAHRHGFLLRGGYAF